MKAMTKNTTPGDLFYVPAIQKDGKHGFVMARYIELVPNNVGYLIEVFKKFYVEPPTSIDEVDVSKRLFRPVLFDMYFHYVPRWKVLFQDPAYSKAQSDYGNIAIAFHTELWKGGKSLPLPKDGKVRYEDATCWSPHQVIFRVIAHLAGVFGENDFYDYHRLPENLKVENPAAFSEVVQLANEIDEKFKVWGKARKSRK